MKKRLWWSAALIPLLLPVSGARAQSDPPAVPDEPIIHWTSWDSQSGQVCPTGVPAPDYPCIQEVVIDGRPLTFVPSSDRRPGVVLVQPSLKGFNCWAPGIPMNPPKHQRDPDVMRNQCIYGEIQLEPNWGGQSLLTQDMRIVVKIRRPVGDNPRRDIGFVKAPGLVHRFVPSSPTAPVAEVEFSPGEVECGSSSFTTSLMNYEPPLYSCGSRLVASVFLATLNVTGAYDGYAGFEVMPESKGAWTSSNSAQWGFFGDYMKEGGYSVQMAGPHFKNKVDPAAPDELVTAYYRAYMPRALLMREFGITPEQASNETIAVQRSVGRSPSQLPSTFTPTPGGLIIDTQGITFSKPVITVKRVVTVKTAKKYSRSKLGLAVRNSVGVPRKFKRGPSMTSSKALCPKKFCKMVKSSAVYTKKGTFTVKLVYSNRNYRGKKVKLTRLVTVKVI